MLQILVEQRSGAPVIPTLAEAMRPIANTATQIREDSAASSPRSNDIPSLRTAETLPTGNIIAWISLQIPEFSGAENDNVRAWTKRVDKVAQVHGAGDGTMLLAASSKLTKSAKRWYEIQDGNVLESWTVLRCEMLRIFDWKIPFFR